MSEKSDRTTWSFEWMPRCEKFLKKSDLAFSSRNQMWEGVGLDGEEEEDSPERKGFWDEVDLRLGAMRQLM